MNNIRSTLAIVWRIAVPYFRSEDRWAGLGLLASVIAIELSLVGFSVLFNMWRNRFYNALQEYEWNAFAREGLVFCLLAAPYILLQVYQIYLNQWLQIRWRRWMTDHYLGRWLKDANHYRMQLKGDPADNPDQRIAEDIQKFIDQTLTIGVGLLSSVVTIASFVVILWGLSAQAPLLVGGFSIPGYLIWAALIYAVLGTALTQWIGRPLVNLDFQQQRFEADFRFNLVRARENAEQIALLKGEPSERERLLARFGNIVVNWRAIMSRTKRLVIFTGSYDQAAIIIPFALMAQPYFGHKILLGGLQQTVEAFGNVQTALSFFVETYRTMADWRSVVARLDGFESAIATAEALAGEARTIDLSTSRVGGGIALDRLLVQLPNGTPLVSASDLSLPVDAHTLVTGPTGAGKSTLFRAIAGVWPFGSGAIAIPANATLMMLPQRPYFPIGTLRAAIAYPAPPDAFGADKVRDVLGAVGMARLEGDLDREAHWNQMLSLGEQQRLAIARALLQGPQYLFLDEATASLDEPSEARLYRLIGERLPNTTIVSIGHRSTLEAFHQHRVALTRDGDRFALQDRTAKAAAS